MEIIKRDLVSIGKWSPLYLQGNSNELDEKVKIAITNYLHKDIKQGLYVTGQFGTGKSTLVGLIAIWTRTTNMDLMYYITASSLFDLLIKSEDANWRHHRTLCIDDLGRQYNTEYAISKFNEFIEYRYAHNLKTFITSNTQIADLRKILGFERIADIFTDKKFIIEFKLIGNSKRTQNINKV